jgi:ABC-type multidrug transport system permease subunit
MRNVILLARHDLKQVLRDRAAVMWMFFLPVVFIGFFGMVMGGGDAGRPADAKVRLTVLDMDGGFLARALVEELASDRIALVELGVDEVEAATEKIRTLVIPEGFTDSIVAGEQVTLRLEKEPDTNQEAALVAQARIVSGATRLIGRLVELEGSGDQPLTEERFAGSGGAEDLVRVVSSYAGRATIAPSGFAQSIPGNTVLFVMLVALTYGAASITAEREAGLIRRLATAPVSRAEIIFGKIGGRLVVAVAQITVLVGVAVLANRFFGITVGENVPAVFAILLVYAVCVAPLGVMIGAWFKDPDRAANIGVLCTLVMGALGGCMWPLEFVGKTLQRLALVFPTGWAMKALHQVISFGRGLGEVTLELGVLLGFAAVFSFIAARSLRVD